MRNWNFYKSCYPQNPSKFWSYLWGIETQKKKRQSGWKQSFDLTYEELKLALGHLHYNESHAVLILPMRNWNNVCPPISAITTSFDLTYEELKRIITHTSDILHFVLILPMRNWNITSIICFDNSHVVLILPMRNWNLASRYVSYQQISEFWSYLWGIGTGIP